ncbi:MAG: carbonic anhydrase, partial [Haloarcula sp.]
MSQLLQELLAGNADHAAEFRDRFDSVQHSQTPDAVTVCCSDSRVLQDHMWGNSEPGHLFTCSNIGNRVIQRTASGEAVSGDVLYPI